MDKTRIYLGILLASIAVYLTGMFVSVMEVDAAQYAGMSIEMLERNDWLHFTDLQKPYLDKPPLVFWTAGISYLIFGISAFSYRIPSLLFFLLGIYATFRLARLFYSSETAWLSALVLATSQAAFMMTTDCRTDTLLTGSVIFACWQIAEYLHSSQKRFFIGGFMGIGMAMLAKGPIGLIVPMMALGTHLLAQRDFRAIFHPKWLLGIPIILVLLSPMLWGLYTQFDLHPEIVVNGEKGVSGLLFYFWTQSFGRITGENTWKNDTDFFFLWHSCLWAFLPWGLLVFVGLTQKLYDLIKNSMRSVENISVGGFLLPLIALSLSSYKLPHYIFVGYPFAAILVAQFLSRLRQGSASYHILYWLQIITLICIIGGAALVCILVFPHTIFQLVVAGGAIVCIALCIRSYGDVINSIVYPCSWAILLGNIILNLHFYPSLLTYQSCSEAGKFLHAQHIPKESIFVRVDNRCAVEVPLQSSRNIFPDDNHISEFLEKRPATWLFTDYGFLYTLDRNKFQVDTLKIVANYKVTALTPAFLYEKSREQTLEKRYIVKVTPRKSSP